MIIICAETMYYVFVVLSSYGCNHSFVGNNFYQYIKCLRVIIRRQALQLSGDRIPQQVSWPAQQHNYDPTNHPSSPGDQDSARICPVPDYSGQYCHGLHAWGSW